MSKGESFGRGEFRFLEKNIFENKEKKPFKFIEFERLLFYCKIGSHL